MVVLTGVLAGCGAGGSHSSTAPARATAVLTVAPNATGPFVNTFNPFLPTSGTASGAVDYLIYEPLYMPDPVNETYRPWLATKYSFSNGGRELTLTIRSGVKWSDGTPLTASDVAYTFNLEKANPSLNLGGLPLIKATASNATTVVVTFSAPAYTYLDPILTLQPVPEHIWAKVSNPTTFADNHPVGSGPYLLKTFTPQAITMVKNPKYWQADKVAVQTIRYVAFDSASSIQSAIEAKQIDLEDHVFTDFKSLVKRPGLGGLLINTGSEEMQINTTKYPLNLTVVRQAISVALDRPALSQQGLNGLQAPISSPTGLPPALGNDVAPQYKNASFGPADPAKAKAMLSAAGFKMGSDGIFVTPKGKPLQLTLFQGTGQTNLLSLGQVMAEQLKAAGIGLTEKTAEFPAVNSAVLQGNFDLYINQDTAFDPYSYYRLLMDPNDYEPVGTRANYDLGRFRNPAVSAIFTRWASEAPGSPAAKASMYAIEQAFVKDVPAIPLCATAPQGVYDTQNFTGWPTKADPYGLPEVIGPDAEIMMLHVKPR